jgi:hypothetical protein
MRSTLRSVPMFCLLLACGGSDSDGPDGPGDEERDAGSNPSGPARSDGGNAAGSFDAGRTASADASSVEELGGDAGESARDGGRRGRDAALPPTPVSDAGSASSSELAQHCVDKINEYRATLKLAPLARAADKELCVDGEAKADSISGTAHSAFGMCKESAQNECPGWPTRDMQGSLDGCLQQMWAEGPGDFNMGHGHWINMSSTKYKSVACGVHDIGNGKFWAVQDFF